MAGTLSEQLAEKSRENHERIDKLAPDATQTQAPQAASPEAALEGIGQKAENAPTQFGNDKPNVQAPTVSTEAALEGLKNINLPSVEDAVAIDTNDMSLYDYKTGKFLTKKATEKEIARTQAANRAGDALWQLFQENPNPSDAEIEAALGKNAFAFNNIYGNKSDNWATAFGSGYLVGKLTPSQRAAVDEYIRNRRAYEDQQAASKQDAARAAHEAQYVVKLGDTEIPITKDFSDNYKSLSQAYARLIPEEGAEDTPENKAKRQQLVGALREQLKAAGIDLGSAPEGGEFDDIQDLVESAPDYQTENTIMQALKMAAGRKEYDPDSQVDVMQMEKEREERKAAIDLRNKNREIERARNRQSIAGLAAMIGDMIRASEGARVDPRDWQQMYDNLSAQEKANVNNYQIRMQKIADDIKQQRMLEKQRADAKAAAKLKLDADAAEKKKDRKLQKELNEANNNTRLTIAEINANKPEEKGGNRSMTNIPMFGTVKFIPSSHNDNTLTSLYGMLRGMSGLTFGISDELTGMERISEIKARVLPALQNATKTESGGWIISYPAKTGGGTKLLTKAQVDKLLKYVDDVAAGKVTPGSETPSDQSEESSNNEANNGADASSLIKNKWGIKLPGK